MLLALRQVLTWVALLTLVVVEVGLVVQFWELLLEELEAMVVVVLVLEMLQRLRLELLTQAEAVVEVAEFLAVEQAEQAVRVS